MSKSYNRGRRRNALTEQFAPRTIRMLESPAYQVLSHSAHRVLARIEIEFGHHGGEPGHENGKLIVTYEQFQQYGIDRHAIAPAIRELVALGFLEVTEQGCGGNAEFRRPSKYRLTYRHGVKNKLNPTNEWQRIETIEEANMIAKRARRAGSNSRPVQQQNQKPGGGRRHVSVGRTHTEKANFPVGETPTTVPVGKTPTTFDISGWRVGEREDLSLKPPPEPEPARREMAAARRRATAAKRVAVALLSTTHLRPPSPAPLPDDEYGMAMGAMTELSMPFASEVASRHQRSASCQGSPHRLAA